MAEDEIQEELSAGQILEGAIKSKFLDAILIGIRADGSFYAASSLSSIDDNLRLLAQAIAELFSSEERTEKVEGQ